MIAKTYLRTEFEFAGGRWVVAIFKVKNEADRR
jgi:hypothetical protein